MASLEMNKIAAGILTAGLVAMGAGKIAGVLVDPRMPEETVYKIDTSAAEAAAGPAAAKPEPLAPVLPLLAGADLAKGEKVLKKCTSCHTLEAGGAARQGPNLYNVVGRAKGAVEGFAYSDALLDSGEEENWSYAALNAFLKKPKDYAPGTKMNFVGLKKVGDRANLIAWLRANADDPLALPTAEEAAQAQADYEAAKAE